MKCSICNEEGVNKKSHPNHPKKKAAAKKPAAKKKVAPTKKVAAKKKVAPTKKVAAVKKPAAKKKVAPTKAGNKRSWKTLIEKERLNVFKKYPFTKEKFTEVLESYGLNYYTIPLGAGTFGDVYDIGNGRVLRLEPSTYGHKQQEFLDSEKLVQYLIKNKFDFTPIIYSETVYRNPDKSFGFLRATVMEKISAVDLISNWRKFYDESSLLKALREIINKLNSKMIYHSDISHNNVLLTSEGRIVFIDLLDACFASVDKTCRHASLGDTPGYRAPEISYYKKGILNVLEAFGGGLDYKTYKSKYDLGKIDKTKKLEIYMANNIFGMGALAYYLLTGKEPMEPLEFSLIKDEKIRKRVMGAMNPIPSERKLF